MLLMLPDLAQDASRLDPLFQHESICSAFQSFDISMCPIFLFFLEIKTVTVIGTTRY